MQMDKHSSNFCIPLQHDEVAATSEEMLNINGNPNPTIIIESYEPYILASGKAETKIHEEKCKSLQDNCIKEEGDDFPQELHSFSWPLNMDEKKIQDSLHILHDTHALVSH